MDCDADASRQAATLNRNQPGMQRVASLMHLNVFQPKVRS